MRCPRCRLETLQSPCPRCGLNIRLPDLSGPSSYALPAQPEDQMRKEYGFAPGEGERRILHRPQAQIPKSVVNRQQDLLHANRLVMPQSKDIFSKEMPRSTSTQEVERKIRFSEQQETQLWGEDFKEIWWKAFDDEQRGRQVWVCEVASRQRSSGSLSQEMIRKAAQVFANLGKHPSAPGLLNIYSKHKHDFFVFEAVEGESLLSHIQRTRQTLPEREALECCLFLAEGIEYFSYLSPPLIHGRISPEHIVQTSRGWMFTNFSPIVASGERQVIAGMDRTTTSFLYAAPDFVQGEVSARSDLYSLLATAYYSVTRIIPSSGRGNILPAQRINPALSTSFNAILMKGLHPLPSQRYQRPSDLSADLRAVLSGSRGGQRQQWAMPPLQSLPQGIQQSKLSDTSVSVADQEPNVPEGLVPVGEFLAASPGSDFIAAVGLLLILLICLLTLISVSRGLL